MFGQQPRIFSTDFSTHQFLWSYPALSSCEPGLLPEPPFVEPHIRFEFYWLIRAVLARLLAVLYIFVIKIFYLYHKKIIHMIIWDALRDLLRFVQFKKT